MREVNEWKEHAPTRFVGKDSEVQLRPFGCIISPSSSQFPLFLLYCRHSCGHLSSLGRMVAAFRPNFHIAVNIFYVNFAINGLFSLLTTILILYMYKHNVLRFNVYIKCVFQITIYQTIYDAFAPLISEVATPATDQNVLRAAAAAGIQFGGIGAAMWALMMGTRMSMCVCVCAIGEGGGDGEGVGVGAHSMNQWNNSSNPPSLSLSPNLSFFLSAHTHTHTPPCRAWSVLHHYRLQSTEQALGVRHHCRGQPAAGGGVSTLHSSGVPGKHGYRGLEARVER